MHRLGLKISLLGVFFFLGPLLPGCYSGRVTFDANSSVVCGPRPHDFANVKRVSLQSPHAGTEFGGSTMTTPSDKNTLYVLLYSLAGTVLSLAATWFFVAHSFAQQMVA